MPAAPISDPVALLAADWHRAFARLDALIVNRVAREQTGEDPAALDAEEDQAHAVLTQLMDRLAKTPAAGFAGVADRLAIALSWGATPDETGAPPWNLVGAGIDDLRRFILLQGLQGDPL